MERISDLLKIIGSCTIKAQTNQSNLKLIVDFFLFNHLIESYTRLLVPFTHYSKTIHLMLFVLLEKTKALFYRVKIFKLRFRRPVFSLSKSWTFLRISMLNLLRLRGIAKVDNRRLPVPATFVLIHRSRLVACDRFITFPAGLCINKQ